MSIVQSEAYINKQALLIVYSVEGENTSGVGLILVINYDEIR